MNAARASKIDTIEGLAAKARATLYALDEKRLIEKIENRF